MKKQIIIMLGVFLLLYNNIRAEKFSRGSYTYYSNIIVQKVEQFSVIKYSQKDVNFNEIKEIINMRNNIRNSTLNEYKKRFIIGYANYDILIMTFISSQINNLKKEKIFNNLINEKIFLNLYNKISIKRTPNIEIKKYGGKFFFTTWRTIYINGWKKEVKFYFYTSDESILDLEESTYKKIYLDGVIKNIISGNAILDVYVKITSIKFSDTILNKTNKDNESTIPSDESYDYYSKLIISEIPQELDIPSEKEFYKEADIKKMIKIRDIIKKSTTLSKKDKEFLIGYANYDIVLMIFVSKYINKVKKENLLKKLVGENIYYKTAYTYGESIYVRKTNPKYKRLLGKYYFENRRWANVNNNNLKINFVFGTSDESIIDLGPKEEVSIYGKIKKIYLPKYSSEPMILIKITKILK